MKIHFTLLLTFVCATSIFAQAPFDYMLFRPGVQYLYESPIDFRLIESPVLGMKLSQVEQDSFAEAYLSILPGEGAFPEECQRLGPSFAGRSIRQSEGRVSLAMDSTRMDLVILETGADVGTSWAVTPTITGRIDSIRTETIFSLTDEVKYLSFVRTDDGTPLAAKIRVSKNHGLLTGTFFWKLETTDAELELVSLSSPAVGPQLPRLADIYDIRLGTELYITRALDYCCIGDTTEFFQQKISVTDYDYSPGDDSIRLYYNLDEAGYFTVRPDFNLRLGQFSRQGVPDSLVQDASALEFLNAQPGEVVYPTINWREGTGLDNQIGVLRAKVFDCYGLGIGLPSLDASYRGDEDECIREALDSQGSYGYYFGGLGGPYFTGGLAAFWNNDIVGAFNEEFDCGEPLDIPVIPGNVSLADGFDWQLFRPGVQYSYGSIVEPFDGSRLVDFAGIRLSGIGTESLPPTARHYDENGSPETRSGASYFGNSVYQSPDSTSLAYSNFTVHLRPAAQIGESWNINENYEATIDSITEETFFELTDSVKYISFTETGGGSSALPVMRISKNYGLLNAVDFELRPEPNLELAGMSSPEVGLQVPTFASITDFQVGDRLDKRFNIRDVDENGIQINNITEQQLTVERVDRITDSLVQVQFLLHELTYQTETSTSNIDSVFDGFQTEVLTYNLREQPYLDAQYNQVFDSEFGELYVVSPINISCDDVEEPGIILKIFGQGEGDVITYGGGFSIGGIFQNRVVGPYQQFIEGAEVINKLLYQSNAVATCGTPLDFDDLISGTNDPVFDERILLYPNPASDNIVVEIPADLGATSLQLYGIDGRLVRQVRASLGSHTLSVASLAPGLYTVVIVNESGWVGRRRVVVR